MSSIRIASRSELIRRLFPWRFIFLDGRVAFVIDVEIGARRDMFVF